MSRLVLVRRGETVWHGENRYAGTSDVGLTAKGFAQAEQLACWAARAQLTAVWSSPLLRARNTTAPAAQAAQLQLQIDPRLQELSFGQAEGLSAAEMHARFPAERVAFERDSARCFLPGGEDLLAAADRGCAALRTIVDAQGPHGGALLSVTLPSFASHSAVSWASFFRSTASPFPSFAMAISPSLSSAPLTSDCLSSMSRCLHTTPQERTKPRARRNAPSRKASSCGRPLYLSIADAQQFRGACKTLQHP